MIETIGHFGDKRREQRGAKVFAEVVRQRSLVQRKVGGRRAGEIAMHRFLDEEAVTREEIVATVSDRTAQRCVGRRILVAQDTTEINFAGREEGRIGLGPAGDGVSAGFLIHAAVAIDIEDEAVVGLAAAEIWTRKGKVSDRKGRKYESRESARWQRATEMVSERFAEAQQLIVVSDREGDIYPYFANCPKGTELIIRAAQNRALQEGGRLFDEPSDWKVISRARIDLVPRKPGEKPRTARLQFRAGRVALRRPKTADKSVAPFVELSFVEVSEVGAPRGVKPIKWRLITTLPVDTVEQVLEIVSLYRLRWRIEQVFRALKNDGLRLPDVQMQKASKLLKLAALGLAAAVRILQTVDARHGSRRSALDVTDQETIDAAACIGPSLEGGTERQKNPYPVASLAWLTWIIARLGGWNCYYKPPGPKTMAAGWTRLNEQARGIILVTQHRTIRT
jgi:hypothetical protein